MRKKIIIGILLGGGVSHKGTLPHDPKTRAKKALKLLKANKIDKLILSGKCSYGNPKICEATAYMNFLIEHGIKKNKLILEEKSRDTIGNAVYSKKIFLKLKLPKNIIVITGNYHLKRALMIFKHIFGDDYTIEGAASRPFILHRIIKKIQEWEFKAIDSMILTFVKKGDHLHAEKLIKKLLPMYKKI